MSRTQPSGPGTEPAGAESAAGDSLLTLSHLTRRYGNLTAVNDVSLRLPIGARHAVIGPNGAGKTTLMNLIAGTERPDGGTILLAGQERPADRAKSRRAGKSGEVDLTRIEAARRSRLGVARSYQQPTAITELTVLDNIMLAAWRHHRAGRGAWRRPARQRQLRESAMRQLDDVGLADQAEHSAGSLSHGQRRMLDLAAALAGEPRLLLLDEPAAGLTDRDIGRLVDVLREIPHDVALLLVEHHIEVVTELADTVTVLAAGSVLVTGSTRDALSDPEVREVYLDAVPTSVAESATGTDQTPATAAGAPPSATTERG